MEVIAASTKTRRWRRLAPWLGLGCILASFLAAVIWVHPTNFFGYTEDDSIYFSSAKGLAEGQGYVLASFPGTPVATKYPIFYPWLLSWVWRWNPSFPANLTDAIAISAAFGAAYLTLAFLFLRRFRGISDLEALLLTAFCALHPLVVFYSGSVLSDIPFAALALAAMLVAEKAMQPTARPLAVICCGLLVGLCMLTRAFAIPVAAGIILVGLIHRAWRPLIVFCGSICPFFAALCWKTIFPRLPVSPASGPAASDLGWTHTWAYCTSYLSDWKIGVPNTHIFLAVLKNNALLLLSTPGSYFVNPELGPIAQRTIIVTLTAAISAGIFREALRRGLRPVHLVLPFYASLILVWHYALAERLLIPFLPLFAAGLWLESKHLLGMVRATVTQARPAAEKTLAITFGVMFLFLFSAVLRNYLGGARTIAAELSKQRAVLLEEKREAYQWLSRSTDTDARVVAYEDASLYLYSGRRASRLFTFTPAEFYEPARLEEDIDHMIDVPRATGAEFWVTSIDDYDFDWSDAFWKGHAQMAKMEQALPIVYRSTHDHVRVYFLGCLHDPEAPSCESASRMLFPANHERSLAGEDLR